MYRSKSGIEKKLAQAKYVFNQLSKFEGRIFVNGGVDEKTGSHPLVVLLSSFAAHGRSVFQYACKEAKQGRKQQAYERFVSRSPIVGFFKRLRDIDIHECPPGTHTTIAASSPISRPDPKTGTATGEPVKLCVESPDNPNGPEDGNARVIITTTITRRIEVTTDVINQLKAQGRSDLVDAAQKGEPLYKAVECEGEQDLFRLCRRYLTVMESFVEYGTEHGFIT